MSTAILHNTFKTTTPLRCYCQWNIATRDYRSLQFFSRLKFSSVIDSLLKGTTNSIIHWIQIRAVCWPHVKLDEVDVLFFQVSPLRWRAVLLKCPFVMTALLGCQTTCLFTGRLNSSSLVGTVDLCGSTELISAKFEMLQIWKCSIDISSSVVVFYPVGWLHNKGEVAMVILLLCVVHFLLYQWKWLKSVYIYGSYRKIKTGLLLFWTTLYAYNTRQESLADVRVRAR